MKGAMIDLAIVCILTFISTNNVHTYPSKPSGSNPAKNPLEANVTTTNSFSQIKAVSSKTSHAKQQEQINPTINTNPPVLSKKKEEHKMKAVTKHAHKVKSKDKGEGTAVVEKTLQQAGKANVNTSEAERKSPDPAKDEMVQIVDRWIASKASIGDFMEFTPDDCRTTYARSRRPQQLRQLLRKVGPGIMGNLERAARGFLSGAFTLDHDSVLEVSKCNGVREIEIQHLKSTGYNPMDWIQVQSGDSVNIIFNYEQMIQQREGVAVTLYINGDGMMNFNGNPDYPYAIDKNNIDPNHVPIDGDLYFKIFLKEPESLTSFLSMVGRQVTDLYTGAGLEVLRASLETLTLRNSVTYIPTEEAQFYTNYIEGANFDETNMLSKMEHLFIICKKGLLKTQCALLGVVANVEANPILKIVPGIDIGHMATKIKLFQGHAFPEQLLLQSSKEGMEDISMLPIYGLIKDVLFNEDREDKEVVLDEGVIADTCFRYRNVGMHNGFDVLVLMCPEETMFKFYLQDLVPDSVGAFLTLLHGDHWKQQSFVNAWITQNEGQLIAIDYVEVSGYVLSDEVVYKQKIVFKPRIGNVTTEPNSGYKLIQTLGFTRILRSSFFATVDQNTVQFGGDGEEEFLGSLGSFQIGTATNGEPTILFGLNVPSNRLLILALRETIPGLGATEADGSGYKTDFDALKDIPLKDLTLDTKVSAGDFLFIADAVLGDIEGAKFQLYLLSATTASCFYKETGGAIHDILDAIRGQAFFDHTWLGYSKIGVMLSPPTTPVGSGMCFMRTNRRTAWSNPAKIGINIDGLTFNCVEGDQGCYYLKRIFSGIELDADLKGWMSTTELYLKGKVTGSARLGAHVTLEDEGGIKITIRIEAQEGSGDDVKDRQSYVRFQGNLKFASYSFPCAVIVAGDSIWLKIIPSGQVMPSVRLYDGMTKISAVPRGKVETKWDENLSVVEVVAEMKMANSFDSATPLVFGNRLLSRFYINPENPLISKFYSCKLSTKRLKMYKILNVLGHPGVRGFFDSSSVKGYCAVYNTDDSDWTISTIGTVAPPGFSMSGILETSFGKGGAPSELQMNVVYVGDNIEMCVTLPILKWGRSDNKKEGVNVVEDDSGEETVSEPTTDAAPDEKILTEGYECVLSDGYGMENKAIVSGPRDEITSTYTDINNCLESCIAQYEKDQSYNAINIKKDDNECRCVKNMRYVEEASGSYAGFKTCTLAPLKTYLVEMYSGKGFAAETFGPKFCYVLPPGSEGPYTAYMKGYLKTFVFEMENAKFELTPTAAFPKRFTNIQLSMNAEEHGVKIFNILERGSIVLHDNAVGIDPRDIAFTVEIDLGRLRRNRNEIVASFDNMLDYGVAQTEDVKRQFRRYNRRLTRWINEVDAQIATIDGSGKAARRQFQMDKMNRARAMNACQKVCADECGFMRLPGWDVQKKCGDENAKHPMSCLKFAKDATYASNVGCVSNCEAERVKSNIDAKEFHARSVESGSAVDRDDRCKRFGQVYRDKIDEIRTIAQEISAQAAGFNTYIDGQRINMKTTYRNGFRNVKSITKLSEIIDPNCLEFQWSHQHEEDGQSKICLNGFFRNMISTLFGPRHAIHVARRRVLNRAAGKDTMIEMVLKREGRNKESRRITKLGNRFQRCMDMRSSSVKVGRAVRSLPSLNNADFTIFGESTTEAFYERSPWVVARKRDALEKLRTSKETPVPRNTSEAAEGNSCSGAKRAAADYGDITRYVHRWIQEHDAAKRTLDERKKEAMKGLKKNTGPFQKENNLTKSEGEAYQFWMTIAEDGMKEWASIEDERLQRYNKESIPVIRKQIQVAYTKGNEKTLQDIFSQRSVDGTNAFKRANIEVSTPNTFSELSKILIDTLENGNSLEEISGKIQDAVRQSDDLHKRTLPCSG